MYIFLFFKIWRRYYFFKKNLWIYPFPQTMPKAVHMYDSYPFLSLTHTHCVAAHRLMYCRNVGQTEHACCTRYSTTTVVSQARQEEKKGSSCVVVVCLGPTQPNPKHPSASPLPPTSLLTRQRPINQLSSTIPFPYLCRHSREGGGGGERRSKAATTRRRRRQSRPSHCRRRGGRNDHQVQYRTRHGLRN